MSLVSSRAAWFGVDELRGDFLPWAVAVVTGLDHFDNAIFSFFASYITGGVDASPDELGWASSAYATASVIIIEQHRLALHQSPLAESVNPYNPVYQNALAIASIDRSIAQQASFLASIDGFYFLIGVAICGGLFVAWQKQID